MFILGVDDTDSPGGLCTTHLATELLTEFSELDLIGYPRLVRLNPNIPWKTRGNGAISLSFGKGAGRRFTVGRFEGGPVRAYPRHRPFRADLGGVLERADRILRERSALGERGTNPAVVVSRRPLPERLYWSAVRELVSPSSVIGSLESLPGVAWRTHRGIRGIVGASAASAWRPRRATYERISYRERERWGTERRIGFSSVLDMDRRFPSTFNNLDVPNRHVVIAPRSPCPVLFGIRAFSPSVLEEASDSIEAGETVGRRLTFASNQGTDDHLKRMTVREIRPYVSPTVRGVVCSAPRTERGGHVFFRVRDGTGEVACAAFEPTKQFRAAVRQLVAGDEVEASGGVHRRPFTLNLEKLRVLRAAPLVRLLKPPCPSCGRTMRSAGKGQGFRCRRCRVHLPASSARAVPVPRSLPAGPWEVPKCARRHLSRPFER